MKTRPNFFAGLRHPSCSRIQNSNVCCNGLSVYELDSSSNVNIHRPRRPATGTPFSSSFRRCWKSSFLSTTRPFSTSAAARISLEEDDDGDEPLFTSTPRDLTGLLQSRVLGRKQEQKRMSARQVLLAEQERQRAEIRKLAAAEYENFRAKVEAASTILQRISNDTVEMRDEIGKLREAFKWICEEERRIREKEKKILKRIAKLESSLIPIRTLVSEYCNLKYEWYYAELSRCAKENQLLEHEYCEIKFADLPELESNVYRLVRSIRSLRTATLFWQANEWLDEFRRLYDDYRKEFVMPGVSARRNIDNLLKLEKRRRLNYERHKSTFVAAINGYYEIKDILVRLGLDSKVPRHRREFYFKQARMVGEKTYSLKDRAHQFRSAYRLKTRARSPFADAWPLVFDSNYVMYSVHGKRRAASPQQVIESHISRVATPEKPSDKSRVERALRQALQDFYMSRLPKSQPSRSPELDIYWRQLDVIAPFELFISTAGILMFEIRYLMYTLSPRLGLWSKLDFIARREHRARLQSFLGPFYVDHASFLTSYEEFRNVNWLRLKTEDRLHSLGEPDANREKGLFTVLKPLSQDLTRFGQWADALVASMYTAWVMKCASKLAPSNWERIERMVAVKFRQTLNWTMISHTGVMDIGSEQIRLSRRQRIALKKLRLRKPATSPRKPTPSRRRKSSSRNEFVPASRLKGKGASAVEQWKKRKRVAKATLDEYRLLYKSQMTQASQNTQAQPRSAQKIEDRSELASQPAGSLECVSFSSLETKKSDVKKSSVPSAKAKDGQDQTRSDRLSCPEPGQKLPWGRGFCEQNSQTHHGQDVTKPVRTKSSKVTSNSTESISAQHDRTVTASPVSTSNAEKPGRIFPRWIPAISRLWSRRRSYSSSTAVCSRDLDDAEQFENCDQSSPCVGLAIPPALKRSQDKLAPDSLETVGLGLSVQHSRLAADSSVKEASVPKFWSYSLYKAPDGREIVVHYCRSLKSTEEVAKYFLKDNVVGFDLEWKAQASSLDSIQSNLSLIQLANPERIALFHVALFKPARNLQDLVAPSLQQIMESPDITKVGVSIKADCTRLRKYLGVNARSIFELSHLYKLVKYGHSNPKLVNKRAVNLSEQMEEHFGLPLDKTEDVRCSDWARSLDYRQVQYAASDPYACLALFNLMDAKRKAMTPAPPLPAHAELDLPIRLV